MKLSELLEARKRITEDERQQMRIEDTLHSMFLKPPYFYYVSKFGPEKVLDAIEHVALQHMNMPDMDTDKLAQEVANILDGKMRSGDASTRRTA